MLGAIGLGFGYGPITPASSDILARRIPPAWYGLVFSMKQTGVPIRFAAAGIVVPLLVVNAGWQAATVVIAAAIAAGALALLPLRAQLNGERRPRRAAAPARRWLWCCAIAISGCSPWHPWRIWCRNPASAPFSWYSWSSGQSSP